MPINERAMNGYIAQAMEKQAPPNYRVDAERQGTARSGAATPDIVVHMPYELRTIVETEYDDPAIQDAKHRLGFEFNDSIIPMKSVIALGIPRELGELGNSEREAALMSDKAQFLMQVVTGKSEYDPNLTVIPRDKPIPVSLQDVVQYAWLAAVPAPYTKQIMDAAIKKMTAAKAALATNLNTCGYEAQKRLTERYGNHDSANKMDSVAGNIVGTLFSMIQLHANLKKWGGGGRRSGRGYWTYPHPNFGRRLSHIAASSTKSHANGAKSKI